MARLFCDPQMYHYLAWPYALAQRALPIWRSYIRQVLPLLPQGSVLEIGPGPGSLLETLSQTQPLVVGLDLAWGMLRESQKRLQHMGHPANLVQGNATHLPFLADSLDAVVMTFSLSAIPEGEAVMREAMRILRPAGVIVTIDIAWPPDGNMGGRLLARSCKIFGDTIHDIPALMNGAGLQVREQRHFGVFNSIYRVVGCKPNMAMPIKETR